ncbi:hypothetical protein GCM10025864_02210 [Luteimicrobium album]|uniref:Uncharacterized protein n=1 Tax=Luteimicrobium album TaxID=1054550 RepID=A0ABQ6HWD7_9MICO|nr:hypothetical protein GCM10025864_02210 [Luteimicrobium album]
MDVDPVGGGGAELVREVGGAVVDDRVGPERADVVGVRGPGRPDDARPGPRGEQHRGAPHVPGRAFHEHGLAGPYGAVELDRQVRGRGRMHDGGQRGRVEARRRPVRAVRGDDGVLGGRALPARVPEAVRPHAVADGEARRARTGRHDRPHQVAPDDERERQRRLVRARPHERVHVVDGHRVDPDEEVHGSRLRDGKGADADRVRRSASLDERRAHEVREGGHRPTVAALARAGGRQLAGCHE